MKNSMLFLNNFISYSFPLFNLNKINFKFVQNFGHHLLDNYNIVRMHYSVSALFSFSFLHLAYIYRLLFILTESSYFNYYRLIPIDIASNDRAEQ